MKLFVLDAIGTCNQALTKELAADLSIQPTIKLSDADVVLYQRPLDENLLSVFRVDCSLRTVFIVIDPAETKPNGFAKFIRHRTVHFVTTLDAAKEVINSL